MTTAPGRKRAALAALAALLAAAAAARAEDAPRAAAKKPYDHYRLIESRNIFSPTASGGAAAASAVASTAPARAPVLTGIVLDARTDTYKGLIETPGQPDPLFVGAGDATPLGRVSRVEPDRLLIQVEDREIAVPVGGAMTPDGAVVEPAPDAATATPEDAAKSREILERLKTKVGRKGDTTAEAAPAEPAPPPVVEEKHRSILDLLKSRRRRTPGEGEKK
jgi:hypothetical protein